MLKRKIANGTFCVLLSAILVITMMSALMLTTSAQTTPPVSYDSEWTHENIDGKGTNYITMSATYLNYYFVQSQDNQQFSFTPKFSAFKNDGVNTVIINSVNLLGDSSFSPDASWKEFSSLGVNSSPNGVSLPGAFGSGYDSQKANKMCIWGCTYTFNGNGAATYTPYWEVDYTAGSSGFNKKTYNTTSSGEPINFTINVCDVRELISLATAANTALEGTLTENQRENLEAVLGQINSKELLSAVVYCEQTEINSYVSALKNTIPADYSEVNKLVSKVEALDGSNYNKETWNALTSLINSVDYSYMLKDQAKVDAYASAISKAVSSLTEAPADYTAVNELVARVNQLDSSVYTEETWNNIQNIINSIDRTLTAPSQSVVDGYATSLNSALTSLAEKPADYTALNALVANVNAMDSSMYTEETWNNLQSILNSVDYTLKISSQSTVDGYATALNTAMGNLESKDCDYTLLNGALALTENIKPVNDGRYSDTAFLAYTNALNTAKLVQTGLKLDVLGVNQLLINNAAEALNNAITVLEQTKKPVVSITDSNGNVVSELPVDNSGEDVKFSDIKETIAKPQLKPDHIFLGWKDSQGNDVTDDTVINGDVELVPVSELNKIKPNSNGNTLNVIRDNATKVINGLNNAANTVTQLKENLENDSMQIIVTRNDVELGSQELVGTGCVVKCVSSLNPEVVYEQVQVVLYGDLNGDGKIDDDDQTIMNEKAFSLDKNVDKTSLLFIAADLDGDGAIDGFDYYIHDLQLAGVKQFDQTIKTF